jgi:hypothetical protein
MKGDTVMGCNHEKVRCTDNRFFCLICGQEIQRKAKPEEIPQEEQPAKKKKTTKKEG